MKSSPWVIVLVFALSPSLAQAGPTEHFGKEATKGAVEQVKAELTELDGAKISREISSGVMRELRAQLGADGDGPLARSLAEAAELSARHVVRGIGGELAAQVGTWCGPDEGLACVDALVQRFAYTGARAAAQGAADGAAPWPALITGIGGFLAGLLCSAIIVLLLQHRWTRRELGPLRNRRATDHWRTAHAAPTPPSG